MTRINHAQSKTIIEAAFAKGNELGLKPLSIAVLDPGGHLIAFERADGASLMRYQIANGKAAGALALGLSSRKIAEIAAERPTFIASLGPVSPAGIIPAAGGVIVVDSSGNPLGAVGVTGDTSDNDELCAIAGIEAAGLIALC
tara:strand:+ start:782 stop:1210 length:429 start_codon:yes stop_codon:yes gene_type:complete